MMSCGRKTNRLYFNCTLSGKILYRVSKMKDLGVFFTITFQFYRHINEVVV